MRGSCVMMCSTKGRSIALTTLMRSDFIQVDDGSMRTVGGG
jgi:hypothetical protein